MPAIIDQLQAARRTVLAVDETQSFGVLVVRGGDRRSWLNGLVTCDMNKLTKGQALYGLAVTPKGRVLSDLIFVEGDDQISIVLPMSEVETVVSAFDHYLVMEDAELEAAPAYRIFTLQGPKSGEVLAHVTSRAPTVLAASLDRFGVGGAIVIAPEPAGDVTRDALECGANEAGGVLGDHTALEALRIECGVPRFGADFGPSTYPQEAGLETGAVSFDKGCYLGQEIVCMLQLRGHVKRKLVSLELEEGTASAGAAIASDDGQEVGQLTSVTDGPSSGRPVGLGMVKVAFTTPGTPLRIGEARARVR